jgi:hypothetical protein
MQEIIVTLRSFIVDYLDPIGIVIGVVIALPVFHTWYQVTLGRKRQQRRWFREVSERPGERPGILVVDLLDGRDAKTAIANYCAKQLNNIPKDRQFEIVRVARLLPNDMPELLAEIRKVAGDVAAGGVDTLHYFHAGPAIVSASVGAQFANACRVILYQYEKGSYTKLGPMRLEE